MRQMVKASLVCLMFTKYGKHSTGLKFRPGKKRIMNIWIT